ncbi:MAG: Probable poly(beta-D-mannuronate) O-acetylase (EC [uncultured Sulfurovum sp.]|uniref:Probable poly(Beta-D-mannuronate) O-acetylase (EC) n=1 Tax=uncultured Sulfurovum sp. TaxID=269237 RepID=A0A6S6TKC6_9BACT|nr:MAG: Probable poly(beta-D-mannuronate) O-acetylase (EC [uncultured Sulfurovum sp.]
MLFNSYEFIFLFLPFSFFVYFYLNKKHYTELSKGFLVAASLFFYSWWNIIYLPLILLSLMFNYNVGKLLSRKHKSKLFLAIGITANLALLGYFKYADFFIGNINSVAGTQIPLLYLALPLAISFYTFQQIAYLVDSYRNETKEYNFLNYAVFVTFFPQLIAGPIVHHSEMMPQFAKIKNKVINYRNIALGLFIFSMGLFKKVAIADSFAVWASQGFDAVDKLNMLEGWITSLSYTFQLYFDFSGYTDMAIGAALLFNIKLPINFNSPYKALNIQDFWRRWHMTLSRFLKDYIYIPLGGNRKGEFRTYTNLFATFVLGGIWHGAGWTFVFWGVLHGLALVIHRAWQKLGFKMYKILAWFITFNFINVAWVFFRAKSFDDALTLLSAMFMGDFVVPSFIRRMYPVITEWGIKSDYWWLKFYQNDVYILLWLVAGTAVVLLLPNSMQWMKKFRANPFYISFTIALFMAVFLLHRKSEFIYFNF